MGDASPEQLSVTHKLHSTVKVAPYYFYSNYIYTFFWSSMSTCFRLSFFFFSNPRTITSKFASTLPHLMTAELLLYLHRTRLELTNGRSDEA